jgi:hypothetical protein
MGQWPLPPATQTYAVHAPMPAVEPAYAASKVRPLLNNAAASHAAATMAAAMPSVENLLTQQRTAGDVYARCCCHSCCCCIAASSSQHKDYGSAYRMHAKLMLINHSCCLTVPACTHMQSTRGSGSSHCCCCDSCCNDKPNRTQHRPCMTQQPSCSRSMLQAARAETTANTAAVDPASTATAAPGQLHSHAAAPLSCCRRH